MHRRCRASVFGIAVRSAVHAPRPAGGPLRSCPPSPAARGSPPLLRYGGHPPALAGTAGATKAAMPPRVDIPERICGAERRLAASLVLLARGAAPPTKWRCRAGAVVANPVAAQ